MGNTIELNQRYPTSIKSLKLFMNWWLCTKIHNSSSKVVGLWKMSSPPAHIRNALLLTLTTFHKSHYRAEWRLPNKHKISIINYEFVVAHWDLYHASLSSQTIRDIFTVRNYTAFSIDKILSYCSRAGGQLLTILIILQRWGCWKIINLCLYKMEYLLELRTIDRMAG